MASERPNSRTGRLKPGFVEKTLADITHNIEQAVFTEEIARKHAFLQSLDPRLKLVLFGALIVATGLAHNVASVGLIYAFTLVLALVSSVPFDFFVKRVWLGIPFFAGVVVLPSLFMIPGSPLIALHVPATSFIVTISFEAAMGAILFIARVGTSVSLGVLMVITTRWPDLLKALSVLHVPEVFVLILGMTYRYIFLFLHTLDNMLLSRKSRTAGYSTGGEQRQWIVASIGVLLGKSFQMSSEVYQAMLSRGFSGRVRTLDEFQMKPRDWAMAVLTIGLMAAVLVLDRRILR